jgi:hypothetical protein
VSYLSPPSMRRVTWCRSVAGCSHPRLHSHTGCRARYASRKVRHRRSYPRFAELGRCRSRFRRWATHRPSSVSSWQLGRLHCRRDLQGMRYLSRIELKTIAVGAIRFMLQPGGAVWEHNTTSRTLDLIVLLLLTLLLHDRASTTSRPRPIWLAPDESSCASRAGSPAQRLCVWCWFSASRSDVIHSPTFAGDCSQFEIRIFEAIRPGEIRTLALWTLESRTFRGGRWDYGAVASYSYAAGPRALACTLDNISHVSQSPA